MNLEAKIRSYIAENLLFSGSGYNYSDEASFLEEGIVDSIGIMELVAYVEDEFKVTVNDLDVTPDNFDSVSKLARYIRSKSPLLKDAAGAKPDSPAPSLNASPTQA